ncbi:MAG: hypothetical protein NVS2B12_06120 [Ktedonobacteraceae bacterium]
MHFSASERTDQLSVHPPVMLLQRAARPYLSLTALLAPKSTQRPFLHLAFGPSHASWLPERFGADLRLSLRQSRYALR